ncbi:cytochrome c biogenesis protein CcsA [soil metagenome]
MEAVIESGPGVKRRSRFSLLAWLWPVVLIAAQAYAFAISPPDRDMGELQKIMYVHVPAAWNAFIAFFIVFVASIMYLWKRNERYDLLAASAAEVGAVLTALTLILGSIWGRPTWGVWWTWDARLTSTAVLLVIFVGYLALRAFTEDQDRRARWSAAVGILGAMNVPIVYMSVRWWRTLHQVQSTPSTVDSPYAWGLRANAIAFLIALIYFVRTRYVAARVEREAEQRLDAAALAVGG